MTEERRPATPDGEIIATSPSPAPADPALYRALSRWSHAIPETTVAAFSFLLLCAIALIDLLTGYEVAFSLFYVAPVAITAWRSSVRTGLLLAALSATVWAMADYWAGHEYSHWLVLVWNSIVRLSFFAIIALLIAKLHGNLLLLDRLSRIDPLTGALNGRAFLELAERELEQARRYGTPFTLLFIDLDDFKSVNDRCGHAAGDALLRSVIDALRDTIRATDLVGRVGGDEFVVLLSHSAGDEARETVRRLRRDLVAKMTGRNCPVTMSIGAVSVPRARYDMTLDTLLGKADELMYRVKRSSKNDLSLEIFED